jgi:hypothetical protein
MTRFFFGLFYGHFFIFAVMFLSILSVFPNMIVVGRGRRTEERCCVWSFLGGFILLCI